MTDHIAKHQKAKDMFFSPRTDTSIDKKTLRGFDPLANYADRATAACWRSNANFYG
jgi:hypothetical protein